MISAKIALIVRGGLDGVILEAGRPEFLDECQQLNGCETGDCKVTLGYKLPGKYAFHTVRPRDKNDYNLNGSYKSCLQKVRAYNVKFVAFSCGAIGIPGFDPRKAVKMVLATVRFWLESNNSSIDHVIFRTYENADYEVCKELMSTSLC